LSFKAQISYGSPIGCSDVLGAEAGIRQFLDIGTGIPGAGSTHEVAQQAARGFRIVYVDHAPIEVYSQAGSEASA
jgi:hypothetical protein